MQQNIMSCGSFVIGQDLENLLENLDKLFQDLTQQEATFSLAVPGQVLPIKKAQFCRFLYSLGYDFGNYRWPNGCPFVKILICKKYNAIITILTKCIESVQCQSNVIIMNS